MVFRVGDKVIHLAHGLGEIVRIEEKKIGDRPTRCYVFCAQNLTTWIPIDEAQQHSLRQPTHPDEMLKLFDILTAPGETLQRDRVERRDRLVGQMREGQLASICRVVRDLTNYKRSNKLNDQERSILDRATNSLVTEWAYSMGVSLNQAHQAMDDLLNE